MRRRQKLRESLPILGRVFGRLSPYVRRERPLLAGSFAALFAGTVLQLLEPWPLKFVFDRIIATDAPTGDSPSWIDSVDSMTLLTLAAVAMVVITALRALADYFNRVGLALAGNRVLTQVRNDLYCHVQSLSLAFHSRARSGDLVVRLIGDVTQIRECVVTALLPMLANILILVGMVAIMFVLEWRLALVALAVIPLFGLTTIRLSSRIHQVARKQRERQGALASAAAESMGAMKVIQTLSLEDSFSRHFSSESKRDLKESVKGSRLSARLERTVDVLVALGSALVLWYGARLVLMGRLTPGDLLVFLTYLKRAFRPARDFAKYAGRISKAAAAGERVVDLLGREPEVRDLPTAVPAPSLQGAIRFEDVQFRYEEQKPVFDHLDLEVPAGKFVALVGPSGIGKSTLISLLLRLYDPQAGRVLIDGHDIRDFTLNSLRSQVSVVLQDNLLFAANLWENIGHGASDASHQEIEAAARLANADEFIEALPDGYDTVLGERGVTLSHGQRQRIAIARAAVRRSPILVLDEPSTGLDRESENAVMEALQRLATDRTTILVTHDLAQAERAEEIFLLGGGRVIERGDHHELMNIRGRYESLYQLRGTAQHHPPRGSEDHAFTS